MTPQKISAPKRVFQTPTASEHCWNCYQQGELPWRLPVRRRGKEYVCMGAFCTPQCAKRYALDRLGSRGVECCAMVSELVRLSAGPHARCAPAPPFMALEEFGGPLPREQYHSSDCVVAPPHVHVEWLNVHM